MTRLSAVPRRLPALPALAVQDLSVRYHHTWALRQVSGHFAQGSLTAVVGANGAGKSTLLKSLAGLVTPERHSRITRAPGLRVAYLPQHSELDRTFPLDVQDCVLMGLWEHTGAWGSAYAAGLEQVSAALATVGLQGLEKRMVGTLSNGQLQRALFARLLVQDADILLLDEPFNAVDRETTEALMGCVQQWHRRARTVIAVLHDDALVRAHFPDTLVLAGDCLAWGPTADALPHPHEACAA